MCFVKMVSCRNLRAVDEVEKNHSKNPHRILHCGQQPRDRRRRRRILPSSAAAAGETASASGNVVAPDSVQEMYLSSDRSSRDELFARRTGFNAAEMRRASATHSSLVRGAVRYDACLNSADQCLAPDAGGVEPFSPGSPGVEREGWGVLIRDDEVTPPRFVLRSGDYSRLPPQSTVLMTLQSTDERRDEDTREFEPNGGGRETRNNGSATRNSASSDSDVAERGNSDTWVERNEDFSEEYDDTDAEEYNDDSDIGGSTFVNIPAQTRGVVIGRAEQLSTDKKAPGGWSRNRRLLVRFEWKEKATTCSSVDGEFLSAVVDRAVRRSGVYASGGRAAPASSSSSFPYFSSSVSGAESSSSGLQPLLRVLTSASEGDAENRGQRAECSEKMRTVAVVVRLKYKEEDKALDLDRQELFDDMSKFGEERCCCCLPTGIYRGSAMVSCHGQLPCAFNLMKQADESGAR